MFRNSKRSSSERGHSLPRRKSTGKDVKIVSDEHTDVASKGKDMFWYYCEQQSYLMMFWYQHNVLISSTRRSADINPDHVRYYQTEAHIEINQIVWYYQPDIIINQIAWYYELDYIICQIVWYYQQISANVLISTICSHKSTSIWQDCCTRRRK